MEDDDSQHEMTPGGKKDKSKAAASWVQQNKTFAGLTVGLMACLGIIAAVLLLSALGVLDRDMLACQLGGCTATASPLPVAATDSTVAAQATQTANAPLRQTMIMQATFTAQTVQALRTRVTTRTPAP